MKICIVTANTGKFETNWKNTEQSIPCDFYNFNDENFPMRDKAMNPRLQARIPKMFAWQMVPSYDYYIWIDSSFAVTNPDFAKWMLSKCEDKDAAFLHHPNRQTIQQEYDYVVDLIEKKHPYIIARYENEFLKEQLNEIFSDKEYVDDLLIASGVFIYKNTPKMQAMMKEWWYHTSRYTTLEQLSLPYVLKKFDVKFNIVKKHYMYTHYLTYSRNKKESQ